MGIYREILKTLYYNNKEELNNEVARQVKARRPIDEIVQDLESIVSNQETVQAIIGAAIDSELMKQEIRERIEMIRKLIKE